MSKASGQRNTDNIIKVDFAIITILPEECQAIYKRFEPELYRDPASQNTYGISQIQTREGNTCTVAIARTSRPGNDASQRLASQMIHDLDPQVLLVVGIGSGVPDNDFTLGDVIVSSHIHNFDLNAIKSHETTYDLSGGIDPVASDITANLYLYQKHLADWNSETSIDMARPSFLLTEKTLKDLVDNGVDEAWREKVAKALRWHFDRTQRGKRAPKFFTGPIASSNTHVYSQFPLTHWLQSVRSIRAVEMETAGVYQAAQQRRQQYPVLAIRGISDIIGCQRNDDWKHYACHTAAAFAYAFVAADIVEPRKHTIIASGKLSAAGSVPTVPLYQASSAVPKKPSKNARWLIMGVIATIVLLLGALLSSGIFLLPTKSSTNPIDACTNLPLNHHFPQYIGASRTADNICIGISDGSFAFDWNTKDRPPGYVQLKSQVMQKLGEGD